MIILDFDDEQYHSAIYNVTKTLEILNMVNYLDSYSYLAYVDKIYWRKMDLFPMWH